MRRFLTASAVAALGLSLLTGPASAVAPVLVEPASQVEPAREVQPAFKRVELPACETADAMNCIESIEYLVDGQWRTGILKVGRWTTGEVPNGNPIYGDPYYEYETPDLLHEGNRTSVAAMLVERDDVNGPPYSAYEFNLEAWPNDMNLFWDPPVNRCTTGSFLMPGTDPCPRQPWLADTEYRFTFKTSTLSPIFSTSGVIGLTTTVEEVEGGLRVSIMGRPGPSQFRINRDSPFWTEADADRSPGIAYGFSGLLPDARGRGGILSECQGLGIGTAYSNGTSSLLPEWDARTGSLSFGTNGLHYGPDGKVYRGEAEIMIPGPLARCMWKVDPRQVARMEIEVFTENGEEAVGTKSIAYDADDDVVRMVATNFTFSRKDVVARPSPLAAMSGKRSCNATKTLCVTVDKERKTAKVSLSKVKGAQDVTAVALRGKSEDSSTRVSIPVRSGNASITIQLSGKKAKGQVWVLRTSKAFISSFQVG
jgi:hypothetical protein